MQFSGSVVTQKRCCPAAGSQPKEMEETEPSGSGGEGHTAQEDLGPVHPSEPGDSLSLLGSRGCHNEGLQAGAYDDRTDPRSVGTTRPR